MKAFPSMTGAVGMELRDYFAAAVLTSIAMSAIEEEQEAVMMAKVAYKIADAMMYIREETRDDV